MRLSHSLAALLAASLGSYASPAFAEEDWLARCRLPLADDSKPESGKYLFLTRGKVAGANARAQLDYSTGVSARAAAYPTEARDLLNPYSNLSLSVTYVTPGDGKGRPALGAVSIGAIGKDFNAIPGAPITLKVIIDGETFGPYEPKPVSSGMYSVWLDTAETDGDGKPPRLSPAEFGKLAKAVDAMKTAEFVLVREGIDIVRGAIPAPQLSAWRDGLPAWAAKINPGVGAATYCPGGEILN
jgi:hypothetical protein